MKYAQCCGNSPAPYIRVLNTPPNPGRAKNPADLLPKEGMTLLTYLGATHSTQTFFGPSGTLYYFGGERHRHGQVLNSDASFFLELLEGGKHLFVKMTPTAAAIAKPLPEVEHETNLVEPSDIDAQLKADVEKALAMPHDPPTIAEVYQLCEEAGIDPGDLKLGAEIPKLSQVKRAITLAKKAQAKRDAAS